MAVVNDLHLLHHPGAQASGDGILDDNSSILMVLRHSFSVRIATHGGDPEGPVGLKNFLLFNEGHLPIVVLGPVLEHLLTRSEAALGTKLELSGKNSLVSHRAAF